MKREGIFLMFMLVVMAAPCLAAAPDTITEEEALEDFDGWDLDLEEDTDQASSEPAEEVVLLDEEGLDVEDLKKPPQVKDGKK